jgi:hypothetical protein
MDPNQGYLTNNTIFNSEMMPTVNNININFYNNVVNHINSGNNEKIEKNGYLESMWRENFATQESQSPNFPQFGTPNFKIDQSSENKIISRGNNNKRTQS